jgi:hypothetical protein
MAGNPLVVHVPALRTFHLFSCLRFGWVGDEQAHFGGIEKETEDESSVSLTIYAVPIPVTNCVFFHCRKLNL